MVTADAVCEEKVYRGLRVCVCVCVCVLVCCVVGLVEEHIDCLIV